MKALQLIAGVIVFGIPATAFLLGAISQFMFLSGLRRMKVTFPEKWRELGATEILSRNSRGVKAVIEYLRSPDADELGDPSLPHRVRLAWRLNITSGVIFLLWIAFVIWINCIA